jgi:hypothetical protein
MEIFLSNIAKLNNMLISYLKENQMEIIIGLIIVAGLAFVLIRKSQLDEANRGADLPQAPYKVEAPEVKVAEVNPQPVTPPAAPKAKATAKPRATKPKAAAKPKAAPKAKAPAKPRAKKPAAK